VPCEQQNNCEILLTVTKLFFGGLREGMNQNNVRQHFARFRNVLEVDIMKDRQGTFNKNQL
jgi:hypothetical protein